MAQLNTTDIEIIENFLEMKKGYVLNFSDTTFSEFFSSFSIDINCEKYSDIGTSKAKRMRSFLKQEDDLLVGNVLEQLARKKALSRNMSDDNYNEIVNKLLKKDQYNKESNSPITSIIFHNHGEAIIGNIGNGENITSNQKIIKNDKTSFILMIMRFWKKFISLIALYSKIF
jgi:hypothetical protein